MRRVWQLLLMLVLMPSCNSGGSRQLCRPQTASELAEMSAEGSGCETLDIDNTELENLDSLDSSFDGDLLIGTHLGNPRLADFSGIKQVRSLLLGAAEGVESVAIGAVQWDAGIGGPSLRSVTFEVEGGDPVVRLSTGGEALDSVRARCGSGSSACGSLGLAARAQAYVIDSQIDLRRISVFDGDPLGVDGMRRLPRPSTRYALYRESVGDLDVFWDEIVADGFVGMLTACGFTGESDSDCSDYVRDSR